MQKINLQLNGITAAVLGVLVLAVIFFAGISFGASFGDSQDVTGQSVNTLGCGTTSACVKVVSIPSVEYKLVLKNREGNIIKSIEDTSGNLATAPIQILGDNSGNAIRGIGSVEVFVIGVPEGYNIPRDPQTRSINDNEYETIELDIQPTENY